MAKSSLTDARSGIRVESNGSAAGNHFLAVFYECQREYEEQERAWIEKLRASLSNRSDGGMVGRQPRGAHGSARSSARSGVPGTSRGPAPLRPLSGDLESDHREPSD